MQSSTFRIMHILLMENVRALISSGRLENTRGGPAGENGEGKSPLSGQSRSPGRRCSTVSTIAGIEGVAYITLAQADIGAAVDPENIGDQLRAVCRHD